MTKRHLENSSSTVQEADTSFSKKRKVENEKDALKQDKKSTSGREISKEERKRLKKLSKSEINGEAEAKQEVKGNGSDGADLYAVRKAEKARMKASKKQNREKLKGDFNDHTAALSIDTNDTSTQPVEGSETRVRKQKQESDSTKPANTEKPRTLHKNTGEGLARTLNGNASDLGHSSGYEEHSMLRDLPQSTIDSFLSTNFITITDPASSNTLRPVLSFSHLPASALTEPSPFTAFKCPTAIQSAAWPFLLSGRDVIGIAETGSGKTLAFGVPCVRYISSLPRKPKNTSPARAVIISPTRELAVQIHEQVVELATPASLKTVCVYGGVPKDAQRSALKTAHIIVATPGRLNDLINEGSADLSGVGYLVLDEADRMLDKGFEDEIRKIVSTTPSFTSSSADTSGRQTLMFTATWPPSVRQLASTFMRFPVKIAIGDNPAGELRANARIVQKVEVIDPRLKETRLLQLIQQYQSGQNLNDRILIFCLYKKEATRVEGYLRSKGLRVAGIHGDLSQEKRSASLEAFKREGGTPLLVATDVAARGLDIPAVKLVVNVTFPLTTEDYVHRIGR